MTTAYIEIEVDLGEIDTGDLLAELRDRSELVDDVFARKLFEALKIGDERRAIELARDYSQAATGGILP